MCGIFGSISNGNIVESLIKGLKRLEYRGYDSSGIAIIGKNGLKVIKMEGRISNLEQASVGESAPIGIAHTRWSTHGKPTTSNSHPHISGRFALVHNGIIENFSTLKKQLIAKGFTFQSETDTEVIVHLLHHIYTGNLLHTLQLVSKLLVGTFALAVIDEAEPDCIYATKHDSPLLIGISSNGGYLASDAVALTDISDNIYTLNDDEYAILQRDNVTFYDSSLTKIEKLDASHTFTSTKIDIEDTHSFMLKEMLEIPSAIENTLAYYRSGLDKSFIAELSHIEEIIVIGCGTAYHAGVLAAALIESTVRIPARAEIASEFRYKNPLIKPRTMVLAISQSGETADTIAAIKYAKSDRNTAITCVITNVCSSSIVKHCDYIFPTIAGVEIAVAATKSYNTQLAVIYIILDALAKTRENDINIHKTLPILKEQSSLVLGNFDKLCDIAHAFFTSNNVFFLGRNLDYATALEGSLKLKEISYIYSEGYPAGELKHGTLALIEEHSLVVVIATQHDVAQKTMNAMHEVKARGAKILLVTQIEAYFATDEADFIVQLPAVPDILMPILSIIPLQLFAYFMALAKGNDPDKPRNLAKSVTVE
ncbi:MAG: glutamine--fructose-6-phosphate transaminase (isomerizing) [Bacillota bacterium]